MSDFTPLRSVLYMPSSNAKALEKAKTLPIDAVIFDLEDAVAPDAKEQARENACAAARSGEYGRREVTIRVNGTGTQWHDADLAAACAAGPDGIVVPKVGSGDEVRQLVGAMEAAGAPEHTKLWAMVETPRAMLHCEEIAGASERLAVNAGLNARGACSDHRRQHRAATQSGHRQPRKRIGVAVAAQRLDQRGSASAREEDAQRHEGHAERDQPGALTRVMGEIPR